MPRDERRMRLDEPCDNRWEDLEPVDGGRYCGECDRVVVDLMHVGEKEAWRRFDAAGGDLCVRIREDAAGDAVFRFEPRGRAGVTAVVLSAALAACGGEPEPEATQAAPPVETTQPEPAPADTASAEGPGGDTPTPTDPDDFHVIEEPDGSDHPAHEGEAHAADHHRQHGRMGGARAYPRERELGTAEGDPLIGLDGL